MINSPKTRAKVLLSVFAMMALVVGVSSLGSSTDAQSSYEEVSSGTVDTVFEIAPVGSVSGGVITFNLNSFDVTTLNLSGDPDLQAWANDVAAGAGSGSMNGTLSINASGYSIPLSSSASLPVELNASTTSSSVDADLQYTGTLNAAAGFSGSNLAVSGSPDGGGTSGGEVYETETGFEEQQPMLSAFGRSAFQTVAFGGESKKVKARATRWAVPNATLGSLDITINDWGTTPKEMRKLDKHSVRVQTTAFEYDALNGSASVKQNVQIKRKRTIT